MERRNKHFGVVEGFYRRPYSWEERRDCIKLLADTGCNIYVYGPKIDPFHRRRWKEPYPQDTMRAFSRLVSLSKKMGIQFNYAISPISQPVTKDIIHKIALMVGIGIESFSIFFDDIKVPLTRETAFAQCDCAHELYAYLKKAVTKPMLFFCPTQYRGFKDTQYIRTIAEVLNKKIEIFWTGKHVVSPRITEQQIERIAALYGKPPLIWDNLFANDYIPGVIHAFPYRYRSPALVTQCHGILINPMNQYIKSKPLIYTAALFFKDPEHYAPREAWREAIQTLDAKR